MVVVYQNSSILSISLSNERHDLCLLNDVIKYVIYNK
jgi:hypothetical protein